MKAFKLVLQAFKAPAFDLIVKTLSPLPIVNESSTIIPFKQVNVLPE